MANRREWLSETLEDVIAQLYERFCAAGDKNDVSEMLRVSKYITDAAEQLIKLMMPGASLAEAEDFITKIVNGDA
jgi:hypothetical protein